MGIYLELSAAWDIESERFMSSPGTTLPDTVDSLLLIKSLDTPVHRPEKTAGYSYSSTSACHPVNMERGAWRAIVQTVAESDTTERDGGRRGTFLGHLRSWLQS